MRFTKTRSVVLGAVLGAMLLCLLVPAVPSLAGDTGVLKLKIRPCASSNWLETAKVDVVIYRPGVGNVDSTTGYTNASGYAEFTFTDLENADQARVTVTPKEMSPDSGHTYYWVSSRAGLWDLSAQGDSLCQDGWYDEENNIILTLYQ